MSQSEQIDQLSAALALAQGAMSNAVYNRQNPHFKNRYADLAAVWDAIRGPLSKNGLGVTQIQTSNGNGELWLETILLHKSGQWLKSVHPLPKGVRPQEFGSALTYAKRYCLSSIVGIAADEDDDAELTNKNKTERFGTTAEDITGPVEDEIQEHLPNGDPSIERMTKAMGRPEYALLSSEIRNMKTLEYLQQWGKDNANRVESLPIDWQAILRGEFRDKMLELGWKPKDKQA